MIHILLVVTILMILLVGTIATTLISYNNSSIIVSSFTGYNYANAAVNEQPDDGDNNSGETSQSKDPATVKLHEKVNELIQKAKAAKIEAAKATNEANNAAEEAEALSVAADEADKEVEKMLKSIGDEDNEDKSNNAQNKNNNETESQQNNELDAAISDANDRRKAAELAGKDASDLSDKADALTKAANKAEKLAQAAQKELEDAMNDTNNNNQNTNTEADEAKEDKINDSSDKSNDESSEIQPGNFKNDVPTREGSQNNTSRENEQVNSDQIIITSPENEGSKDSDSKEKTIEKDADSSESDSGSSVAETNVVQRSDNSNGEASEVQASNSDYDEILAQAERNALDSDEPAPVTEQNISISMNQEKALDLAGSNSSALTNTSTAEVNSSLVNSENTTALDEYKQVSNNDITNNSQSNNEIFTNSSGVSPINNNNNNNNTNADNATSVSPTNNTATATIQYEGKVDCDVGVANTNTTTTTTTLLDNSGLDNMSADRQDDGGCYPRASASGQFQYVVWSEGDEDNRYILFKRSMNGKTFDSAITLSGNAPSAVFNPEVSSEGNNVYVVWQGDSQSGNQDILMRKSDDNGKTFGDVINVSNDRAGSGNPEINVNSSNVYVVWDGTTPGNNDIFFRKSINKGSNFDRVRNLSNDGAVSYEPKVVLGEKGIEVYWRDYRNGHEDVLVKKSMNEGRTFDVLQKLNNNNNKDVLDLWNDRDRDRGQDLRS